MADNWLSWNNVLMIFVLILSVHTGIKLINKFFDKPNKKNSLF